MSWENNVCDHQGGEIIRNQIEIKCADCGQIKKRTTLEGCLVRNGVITPLEVKKC